MIGFRLARRMGLALLLAGGVGLVADRGDGAEPSWSPVIVAQGEFRERIEATPIEQRPNRPFHFYGNTIRRARYRGNPLPLPIDFFRTFQFALQRPR